MAIFRIGQVAISCWDFTISASARSGIALLFIRGGERTLPRRAKNSPRLRRGDALRSMRAVGEARIGQVAISFFKSLGRLLRSRSYFLLLFFLPVEQPQLDGAHRRLGAIGDLELID